VIVGTDAGTIYGIRTAEDAFNVMWVESPGSSAKGSPFVDWHTGMAYIGTNLGVTKRAVSNGAAAWSSATSGEVLASPWVDVNGGAAYAATSAGNLYAFDAATGEVLAGYPLATGTGAFLGSPVVIPGVAGGKYVYAGSGDGFFSARVDAPTATLLSVPGVFNSSPSVSGSSAYDVIVIGCADGTIRAYQIR